MVAGGGGRVAGGDGAKVLLVTGAARAAASPAAHLDAPALFIVSATGVAEALRRISGERFDALLLELSAEPATALAPLARLREHVPDLPIIVLTPAGDDALALRALKAGAQDALVHPEVDAALLARSIRYAIERHQLQMALAAMALVDDLTGLYNRRGFQTLARQHMKMAERLGKRVSHIFVDLDGLKAINDSFGHRAGDVALVEAAELLRETFRESDIIARIGGDEFVVLAIEGTGPAHEQWAARLGENLRRRNERPDRRFRLSLSTGIAYYDPAFPCALDELLDRADALMYEQKRAKRRSPGSGIPIPPARFDGVVRPGPTSRAD